MTQKSTPLSLERVAALRALAETRQKTLDAWRSGDDPEGDKFAAFDEAATALADYLAPSEVVLAFLDEREALLAVTREFTAWASEHWPQHAGLNVFEATKRAIASLTEENATLRALVGRARMVCDTTLTLRRPRNDCSCGTEQDSFGPCDTWLQGVDTNCVYCAHTWPCHQQITPTSPETKP